MKFPKFRLASVMRSVLVLGVFLATLRFPSLTWAATLMLLTVGTLCWAVLAAIYRRGAARAFWVGFALFGWVYLVFMGPSWWKDEELHRSLPTTNAFGPLFVSLHPTQTRPMGFRGTIRWLFGGFLHDSESSNLNHTTQAALELPISMPFAQETPLEDVLKYIKSSTTSPKLPSGVRIYIDPAGLEAAEATMGSPVKIDLEGVPLRTSLKFTLEQLDLIYLVQDGLIYITSKDKNFLEIDNGIVYERSDERNFVVAPHRMATFKKIGHCWCALLIGVFGGMAGRRLRATGDCRGFDIEPRPRDTTGNLPCIGPARTPPCTERSPPWSGSRSC